MRTHGRIGLKPRPMDSDTLTMLGKNGCQHSARGLAYQENKCDKSREKEATQWERTVGSV
jgi:hypothetical protein